MKTSPLVKPVLIALALALGGCFGGEDAEDDPAGPGNPGRPSNLAKLSPGLYTGDYAAHAAVSQVNGAVESEFLIGADGTYRFFWFLDNTPLVDVRGNWFQRDSALYFHGITESYDEGGVFGPRWEVEDDTNAVREITETSFVRKEWSPLRQKPLWITYRKASPAPLGLGSFRYAEDFPVDSATTVSYRIGIRLDSTAYSEDFLRTVQGDTVRAYLAEGAWHQIGSILLIDQYTARFFDTASHEYSPDRDTLPGTLMYRVKDASDTGFKMWTGTWDEYRKD